MQHALGKIARQQDAVAGGEPAGLGEAAVGGDEITPRDAVAVDEDDISPGARADAEVADLGEPKTSVLVPDMLERGTARDPVAHVDRRQDRAADPVDRLLPSFVTTGTPM